MCQPGSKTQLMDGKSMKNKTLILVSGASNLYTGLHSFFFQIWKHLGGRCITYLNATRHISVCLNIPIYSETVSALLEWIMDGKSRRWVISYDTIRFCLSQYDSLWDWCNLSGGMFNSQADERSWVEEHKYTPDLQATWFTVRCYKTGITNLASA